MPTVTYTTPLVPRPEGSARRDSLVADPKPVDARLLKKREADRKCQRKIRERAKARVASLEQVVEDLKERDTSGQVEALLKKLADKTSEIDILNKKVKNIQAILSNQDLDKSSTNDEDATTFNDTIHADTGISPSSMVPSIYIKADHRDKRASIDTTKCIDMSADDLYLGAIIQQPLAVSSDAAGLLSDQPSKVLVETGDPIYPRPKAPCDCSISLSTIGAPKNMWRYANEVLSERFQWPDYFNYLDDELKDDTPVRAVVEGWESVERKGPVHPSWQILKKIDQGIFWTCNPRERLAVLYTMHVLFEAHSRPEMTANLPEYYRKRPSEEPIHSYAINYFTWPGLRERFVQQQHRYCTNDFWRILTGGFRVLWPYEFRDCYTRNIETGLYTISGLFRERLSDIRTWTVGPDMFQRFPEFSKDIPSFNGIPPSISNCHGNYDSMISFMGQTPGSTDNRRGQVGITDTNSIEHSNGTESDRDSTILQKRSSQGMNPLGSSWAWAADFQLQLDNIDDLVDLSASNSDSLSDAYT